MAKRDCTVGQQPQRPLRMPLGRRAATQSHQARLERAIGLAHMAGVAPLPASQRRLEPFFHETLLHPVHLAQTDMNALNRVNPKSRISIYILRNRIKANIKLLVPVGNHERWFNGLGYGDVDPFFCYKCRSWEHRTASLIGIKWRFKLNVVV